MHCPLFWLYIYKSIFRSVLFQPLPPLSPSGYLLDFSLYLSCAVHVHCALYNCLISHLPYICLSLHPSVSASISLAHSLYLCLSPSIYICVYLTHSPTLSVSLALSVYVCLCLCFVYPTLVTLICSDSVCPSFCLSVSLSSLTISRELS